MGILSTADFEKRGTIISETPEENYPQGSVLSDPVSIVNPAALPEGYTRKEQILHPNAPKGESHAGVVLPTAKGDYKNIQVKLIDGLVQDLKEYWIPDLLKSGFVKKEEIIQKTNPDKGPWKLRHPEFEDVPKDVTSFSVGDKKVGMIEGIIVTKIKKVRNELLKLGFELIAAGENATREGSS